MALPLPPYEPPYYAAIFVYAHTDDLDGYDQTAQELVEIVKTMEGFLGFEAAAGCDGLAILVSYWREEQNIAAWHDQTRHVAAQVQGRTRWYEAVTVHVAKVERSYGFTTPASQD